MTTKEQEFYDALADVFVGEEIEGESGYINLMQIKSEYFKEYVCPQIHEDIEALLNEHPGFRQELFDKLYDFFHRYFSETGSIYFRYTPLHQKVYERVYDGDGNEIGIEPCVTYDHDYDHVYSSEKDVIVFWKTRMLYYVKSDRLFNSLEVETDGWTFFFDVSGMEHKRANENRDLVYRFREVAEDGTIVLRVVYATGNKKTKSEEILTALRKEGQDVSADVLERAFRVFAKQSQVDYFINKDAGNFLREQFDLWMYRYLFAGKNVWREERIEQLQGLKRIAYQIIRFISQFEDELVRVWKKPKFVLSSNYVIAVRTLRQLVSEDESSGLMATVVDQALSGGEFQEDLTQTIREVYKEPLQNLYVGEVRFSESGIELGYVKRFDTQEEAEAFAAEAQQGGEAVEKETTEEGTDYYARYENERLMTMISWDRVYIDTQYFPEEFKAHLLELIVERNKLDEVLDGFLVKSDNYQALQSLLPRFREKVQLVYMDPPFNTEDSGFQYLDKFLDSSWLSMMKNRLDLAREFLVEDGSLYLHLDHNADYYGRYLLDDILGEDCFQREITWNTSRVISGFKTQANNWIRQHDVILFYGRSDEPKFKKLWRLYKEEEEIADEFGHLDLIGPERNDLHVERYSADFSERIEQVPVGEHSVMRIGDVWNDILSMIYTQLMTRENWSFDNQKPENLLRRIIQSATDPRDFVMDPFAGSGTTVAAAHKLDRRWIGIEMGEYFETTMLMRMKAVVFGDRRPFLSRDTGWHGGGFFKYYELEQYEDVLRNASYVKDVVPFDNPYEDPYEQYVFLRDLKMLKALEIDHEQKVVKVDLSKLYDDIDVPETLANLQGRMIRRSTPEFVEFEDDVHIELEDLDWELVKPLIWW